jgi:chorismate synthase
MGSGLVAAIDEVRVRGDSCGGEVTVVVRNCPKGLGAPVFDKLEAELAKALMSLPASKVGSPAQPHGSCVGFLRAV